MLFGLKNNSVLGIDFGTSYIKMVELELRDGDPFLVNYGQVEMPFTEGTEAFRFQSPEEKVITHFKALRDRLDTKATTACAALPAFTGLITMMDMPVMESGELEKAIRFEAPKYIPLPIEDVALSWEVVRDGDGQSPRAPKKKKEKKDGTEAAAPTPDPNKKMEVLLVAALNKEVERYERYVTSQGLRLALLELEIFSLVRAAIASLEETVLLVDIGSRATNLILVRNGSIVMNRNLNSGGNEMTSALMEALHVNWERAEQMKRGQADLLSSQLSHTPMPTLQLIQYEVTRMLQQLKAKDASARVNRILLTGGSSKMKGLPEYLSRLFQLPVELANPWQHVAYDERLTSSLSELGSSFAIAVGLALGGLEHQRK